MHIPSPYLPVLSLITLLTTTVYTWGSLGHRTTTAVAVQYFPSPDHPVRILLDTLLHSQDPTTASLFPDRIRYIPRFAYTAPWHYIDSHATPPESCTIDLNRDCFDPDGCVVTAIANHTARVADTSLPPWERGQSLRFMLHFFGDVHMPLHTVGWERGGNEVTVRFGGVHTNLHSVWDTMMPKRIIELVKDDARPIDAYKSDVFAGTWDLKNETEAAYAWASFLHARYSHDPKVAEPTYDGEVCTSDAAECALGWAREANAWVCEYVLRDGVEGIQGCDLAGTYFEGAVPIIEEMVFKGGRRLAAWLDVVAREVMGKAQDHSDWVEVGDGEL